MWSVLLNNNNYIRRCYAHIILLVVINSLSSSLVTGLQWEFKDGESIVIEAKSEDELQMLHENQGQRVKRQFLPGFQNQFPFQNQFQFPPGWPFIQQGKPGFPSLNLPGFPATAAPTTLAPTTTAPSQLGTCITRNGLHGKCATFRQCYPVLYSSLEGEEEVIRNPNLAEIYRDASGPCETHKMPNYLIFRADAEFRQNLICCGDAGSTPKPTPTAPLQPPNVSNLFHPQITMRPPWALFSTTTTRPTTQPPQTQRTTTPQSAYPNWPPPFITHPPWTQATSQATRQTTQWAHWTTPSTQRPPSIVTTPTPAVQPPVSSSCGFSKIVGGQTATKGEFPWLVAIMRNGKQFCGGSLIDSQWILTAAHCLITFHTHYDASTIRVQIGDFDIYSNADGPVTIKGVSKLVRHARFSNHYLHNDIALLKLDSPVQFGNNGNNNIQPICLATGGGYEGATATVAGWGAQWENGAQPARYQKVNLPVWTNNQCAAKYGSYAPGGITSHMVCAGSTSHDACRGDSGGPLMRNTGGRYEQVGVVSWGIGCGRYPGVYTRVDHFQDWISRNRVL